MCNKTLYAPFSDYKMNLILRRYEKKLDYALENNTIEAKAFIYNVSFTIIELRK